MKVAFTLVFVIFAGVLQAQKDSLENAVSDSLWSVSGTLKSVSERLNSEDSVLDALKVNIEKVLLSLNKQGFTVVVRNGKVYLSIEEKLLFKSGSIQVDPKGVSALLELAKVLNMNTDVSILIEGHTDNQPMKPGNITDNLGLSVLRATSIARILTTQGNVDPKRVTSAGRGEYFPVDTANTPEARAKNRRTEIILTPMPDESFSVSDTLRAVSNRLKVITDTLLAINERLNQMSDTSKVVSDSTVEVISDIPGLLADTSSMLDDVDEEPDFVQNTFKAARIINSHSTEMQGKNNLDFRICHRFGRLNTGPYELFGFDQAYQRMSFTYGVTDLINIEVGRSSVNKVYDGSLKLNLMRQATGDKRRVMTVVYVGNMAVQTLKNNNLQYTPYYFTNRLYYTHQLLLARKFNDYFSLQLMPTVVHRNFIDSAKYKNTVMSIGIAGRNRVSRKTAITYEYFYVLPRQISPVYHNSFSLGFDIETGGHVFQLHLTNSIGMNEKGFIAETDGDWLKGDVHFGFNISRIFYIGRRS